MQYKRTDENYVYEYVGKNIKKYSKLKGLTQVELADLVNYSPNFISNMESSTYQTFSLGTLWRISLALDIELHQLFIEENKFQLELVNSIEYVCLKCKNNMILPAEIISIFNFIYNIAKNKEIPTFTCPKCKSEMFPKDYKKTKDIN